MSNANLLKNVLAILSIVLDKPTQSQISFVLQSGLFLNRYIKIVEMFCKLILKHK